LEWQIALLLIFGSLVVMMLSGLPIAFGFMVINIIGLFLWWGGDIGLMHLIDSIFTSVTYFTLLPVPMFILMGEVMFQSGIATNAIDALDKWLGRLPGRLSLLAVGAGAIFAALCGGDIPATAMLGSVLTPEMEKRGYKKPMSLGPVMGSGGLAIMIPPSILAIVLGAIGKISIGKLLMAIILPGVLMAGIYATYIILRCRLQPSVAPSYTVPPTPILDRLISFVRYVLPLGFVVFMVVGIIFLGIATPTEASATGALSCFILIAAYGKLNWEVAKKSFLSTAQITIMVLMIITGATAFSQNLAFIGASEGLVEFAAGLPLTPIFILITMQVALLFMGAFMEPITIMMVALPIFMPIVHILGFNVVWFGVIFLINVVMAGISPPFGITLFVMKGVAPPDTTMGDVYRAALPFLLLDLTAMAMIIAFPIIALWLPSVMK